MKKIAIMLLSSSILYSSFATAADSTDSVVAKYKDGEVRQSQVMTQFKQSLDMQPNSKGKSFSELEPNLQEVLVRGYVNMQLILQEAKKQGIESSAEFQEKLNNIKLQLIQQELIEKEVKKLVTDELIKKEYDNLVASLKGQKEYKVSHILLDSEETAKAVKAKLSAKGAKFADIVKEYSKDESSKAKGGELGYIMRGQLVPEFENVVFQLKAGDISAPVKTQFGWHIIKVSNVRDVTVPSFEDAKPNVVNKLTREAVEKYLADLAKAAEVKLTLPSKDNKEGSK